MFTKDTFYIRAQINWKRRIEEDITQSSLKQAGVAIVIADKEEFKKSNITNNKERYFLTMKASGRHNNPNCLH